LETHKRKATSILAFLILFSISPSLSIVSSSNAFSSVGSVRYPPVGNSSLEAGLNYLSAGNRFDDSDSQLMADFARFANDGIKHISVRIMWSVLEPDYYDDYAHLSSSALNNLKRVLQAAINNDIQVNLDFWTQFGYSLGKPSWVGDYWDIGAVADTCNKYVRYMQAVVQEVKTYSCIESYSVLNEPYFGTASNGAACGKTQFQTTFPILYDAIKTLDPTRKVICRFTLSYTPGSGRYDDSVYGVFDAFAVTIYLDPSNPSDTRYNGRWSYWDQTVADCKALNIPLWVIEFGDDNSDLEHVRLHYELSLQKFQTGGVDRAYCWAWQTRSASAESFNVYDGTNPKPAYYELTKYA
jgi:hypothetical protein